MFYYIITIFTMVTSNNYNSDVEVIVVSLVSYLPFCILYFMFAFAM